MNAASADHVTHVTDDDIDALASSDTVATLLPGAEFSTRARYPDARRLIESEADLDMLVGQLAAKPVHGIKTRHHGNLLLRTMRGDGHGLPVAFLTGRPHREYQGVAIAAGAVDFIDKTCGIEELVGRLSRIIGKDAA